MRRNRWDQLNAWTIPRASLAQRLRPTPAILATLLLILALGLRIAEVQRTAYAPINDARSYLALGGQVANLGDYSRADHGAGGTVGPTAYFAPAYPFLLAGVDRLTDHDADPFTASAIHDDRLAQAVVGTVVVALIGLVAFELLGTEAGLIALGLAAIYPVLIELSAVLVAEDLFVAFELLAIYAVLRTHRAEDPALWVLAAGLFTGLAALTHVNGILLVLPLGVALAPRVPLVGRRRRLAGPGLLIAATALTLTPWILRDADVMHAFVPISDESGITLVGTYNPTSAAAHDPPYKWLYYGSVRADRSIARVAPSLNETQLNSRLTSQALRYIRHHPFAPVAVAFDNTRRLLELEGSQAWKTSAASISIPLGMAKVGVVSFWILMVLAVIGLFTRDARDLPRWLWGVPLVMWLSVVLVNAETPRFREPLEPFLILLAACALAKGLRRAGLISSPSASRA